MQGVRGGNARQFDQFFTKQDVANECVTWLAGNLSMQIADFDTILEPSFGAGAFIKALELVDVKESNNNKLMFVDIDASDANHRADFLHDEVILPENNHDSILGKRKDGNRDGRQKPKCLTIGNPPFGKNSSLAVAFFNRAALFSAVIAFIVPKTFRKASIQDRLDRHFVLLKEHELGPNGFLFENESYSVPCVFQIWIHTAHLDISKEHVDCPLDAMRPLAPRLTETPDFAFVSPESQPDIAIRRVGVNAGRLFFNNPQHCSKQSHFFLKAKNKSQLCAIKNMLQSLDLESTKTKFETAGCPSISKSELCSLYIEALHTQQQT